MTTAGVTISRLTLRNYKSVESCDIEFQPLTIFVGRNGAGKSNILDALRFTADSLQNTLEYAVRERGGIDQVRRRSLGGRPTNPAIALQISLPDGCAEYAFRIAAVPGRKFRVDKEFCVVRDRSGAEVGRFRVERGKVVDWSPPPAGPAAVSDRLYLVAASGTPAFRPVYDSLSHMAFHNLNPEVMKFPQRPEPGERLAHDGHNLASVIKQSDQGTLSRVVQYLQAIGIPIQRVQHKQAGALETIEVAQEVEVPDGLRNQLFDAVAMSDGTLRALGILVSILSIHRPMDGGPTLVGIEEPETALHPAAVGALVDALLEAAESTQVVLTCHSPDLLDREAIRPEMIRVVVSDNARTVAGPLSPAKSELLKDHLTTAGELLRLDQLTLDAEELNRQREAKGTLFETTLG